MGDSRKLKPPLAEAEPFLSNAPSTTDIHEYTYLASTDCITNHISTKSDTVVDMTCPENGGVYQEKAPKTPHADIVGEILGPCGKWQMKAIFLIYLTKIPSSWFMACVIFTAPAPQHGEFYCTPKTNLTVVPENKTDWIKVAHPIVEDPHDREFKFDYCNVYEDAHEHAMSIFHNQSFVDPWEVPKRGDNVISCDSFQYHPEYHSVVTQFDLVCSRDVLVAVTQFFHLFGVLWGGIIATKLMEFISPRKLMLIGMVSQIICGCICGNVNSYLLHCFFRCMAAICCGLMYTAGSVIFTDITAGKYKTTAVALFEQFWSVGLILLPGVAHFWSSWSQLYVAISLPTLLLMYLYRWIPDSPRWFLKQGMVEEAKEILLEAAEFNDCLDRVPKDLEIHLQAEAQKKPTPEPSWWSMWEDKRTIINLICCHLGWAFYIVIYYGYLLNIRVYGREYLQVNTIVAAFAEITGTFIGYYFIMCTTNKWMWTSLFNVVGGLVSYTIWLLPPDIKGISRIALYMCTSMVAKMSISSTLTILTTCSTELVPDPKKKVCAYSTIVWARTWLLTAPFVGATSYFFGRFVPQTILGTLTIIGAIITSYIVVPRTFPKEPKDTNKSKYPEIRPEIYTMKL